MDTPKKYPGFLFITGADSKIQTLILLNEDTTLREKKFSCEIGCKGNPILCAI